MTYDQLLHTELLHNVIPQQNLDFTVSDGSDPTEAVSKRTLSPDELNKQLEKLLLEEMAGDEQIFDWVEVQIHIRLLRLISLKNLDK